MHLPFLKKILPFLLVVAAATGLRAQNWQWKFGSPDLNEEARSVVQTPDGGFAVAEHTTSNDGSFILHKLDAAGHEVWKRTIFENGYGGIYPTSLLPGADGGFEVAGSMYENATFSNKHPMIWRLDSLGKTQELVIVTALDSTFVQKSVRLADGNWLMMTSSIPVSLVKIAPDGAIIWQKSYPNVALQDFAVSPNGQIFMAAQVNWSFNYRLIGLSSEGDSIWGKPVVAQPFTDSYINPMKIAATDSAVFWGASGIFLQKRSITGDSIWTMSPNFFIGNGSPLDFYWSAMLPDQLGGITFVSSHVEYPNSQTTRFADLTRLNPDGSIAWSNTFREALFTQAERTSDGGFLLGGLFAPSGTFSESDAFVLKTDSLGILFKNALSGKIARDGNADCQFQPTETPLENWIVEAKRADGTQFFANSDAAGDYFMPLDTGNYQLKVLPKNRLWENCDTGLIASLSSVYDTVLANFLIKSVADCPLLRVDLTAPIFRRCFASGGSVAFCNEGTAAAIGATVELFLPDLISLESASLPFTEPSPGLFLFEIGDIAPLGCGQFTFQYLVSCDAVLGQTLCLSAAIRPDTFCIAPPGWSGASLVAEAVCEPDSVRLSIKNIGTGGMAAPLEYVIVEDEVLMLTAPFQLDAGDSATIRLAAAGTMRRIQSPQVGGHPAPGTVNASVENCGPGGQDSFGWWLQYPQDDGWPFSERECREVVGSFDPNEKLATPIGYGSAHQILPGTDLEYTLNFQNTGTDTAFTVLLRDTLSMFLDPASLRTGASSHAVEWQISGTGELVFLFKNILLPDSFVNEKASHGFVSFKISPKTDVPLGTVVENRAAIYFDFNAPVITNTVFHTIDTGFVTVIILGEKGASAAASLMASPNPVRAGGLLFFEPVPPFGGKNTPGRLRMMDVFGKNIFEKTVDGSPIRVPAGLPGGCYFLFFENEKGTWRTGRILVTP